MFEEARLRSEKYQNGMLSMSREIEQTLGRALGYPRFCDDQKNFPGTTDADGVCVGDNVPESLANIAAKWITEARQREAAKDEEIARLRMKTELPPDILGSLLSIGEVEWGATAEHSTEGHIEHLRETLEITDKDHGQSGPTPMHGIYVKGTEKVLCHTGTSPNSPQHARILAGAWNQLVQLAHAALAGEMQPPPMDGAWRCSNCGDMIEAGDSKARWNGEIWEHKCGDPQSGHHPCRYFAAQPQGERTDTERLKCDTCNADYAPRFAGRTCIECDGTIGGSSQDKGVS